MTAICPACGTRVDTDAAESGSVLYCPGCNRPFRWSLPATEELSLAGEDEASVPSAAGTPREADTGVVRCTICKTANPANAKVCAHCGAVLKRKHWDKSVVIPATTATLPGRRRPMTLLLLFGIAILLVGGVFWMAGRLLVAVETPSIAYTRMAGMAANGDWNRFCDRLHPRTQQAFSSMAQGGPNAGVSVKQMFATPDFGKAFMAIQGFPYQDFTITKEEVTGDRARLTVKAAKGDTAIIFMSKDQGVWKLHVPDVEGPE